MMALSRRYRDTATEAYLFVTYYLQQTLTAPQDAVAHFSVAQQLWQWKYTHFFTDNWEALSVGKVKRFCE